MEGREEGHPSSLLPGRDGGAVMIAAPACSDAGTDHDLQVPCLRGCRLRLRLVKLVGTEAWVFGPVAA